MFNFKKITFNFNLKNIILFSLFFVFLIIGLYYSFINNNNNNLGHHLIVDIDNINNNKIFSNSFILKLCNDIIKSTNINVLKSLIHKFKPHGLTALYLLAESHFSIHTWPEEKKIRLDLFSCNKNNNFDKAINIIKKNLPESKINITKINR
tara:strand:- start:1035 stop:1487 length:453 start_codon:yes stop_codon:yes gene_type:complete